MPLAVKEGKTDEAKALVPVAQKALAAIPSTYTGSWAYLAHKTRVAGFTEQAAGTSKPGVKLVATTGGKSTTEMADAIDWTDPQGQGWGHNRIYQGFLVVPKAGEYEISLESVGTAVVSLDDSRLIDHPYHLPSERSAKVSLTEGAHPIRVDVKCYVYGYTHANKPHMVRLRWTPPGGRKTIVPGWALEYRETQPEAKK